MRSMDSATAVILGGTAGAPRSRLAQSIAWLRTREWLMEFTSGARASRTAHDAVPSARSRSPRPQAPRSVKRRRDQAARGARPLRDPRGDSRRGAMGVVYKARDPLIDRMVAIKTVALGLSNAETEAFERRFFREAKSAGRLNHPNVVTIHDVGKCGDIAYIAMEFLDGRSLREILDSGVVLPPERDRRHRRAGRRGPRVRASAPGRASRREAGRTSWCSQNGAVKITDFGIALLPTGTRTLRGQRVRLAALHVARTGDGPHGRRPLRHLLAGRGALRDADRPAALCRRRPQRHPQAGAAATRPLRPAATTRRCRARSTTSWQRRSPRIPATATRTRTTWRRTCAISRASS